MLLLILLCACQAAGLKRSYPWRHDTSRASRSALLNATNESLFEAPFVSNLRSSIVWVPLQADSTVYALTTTCVEGELFEVSLFCPVGCPMHFDTTSVMVFLSKYDHSMRTFKRVDKALSSMVYKASSDKVVVSCPKSDQVNNSVTRVLSAASRINKGSFQIRMFFQVQQLAFEQSLIECTHALSRTTLVQASFLYDNDLAIPLKVLPVMLLAMVLGTGYYALLYYLTTNLPEMKNHILTAQGIPSSYSLTIQQVCPVYTVSDRIITEEAIDGVELSKLSAC